MFGSNKVKLSKDEYAELLLKANGYDEQLRLNEEQLRRSEELEERIKSLLDSKIAIPEDSSAIIFYVDNTLKIRVKTMTNPSLIDALVDEDYLLDNQREDEEAINLAMVVVANDVTDQMITSVNERAEAINEFLHQEVDMDE